MDLALDTTGDLDWDGADLVAVTGLAERAQEVRIRWRRVLGEWFEDTTLGIDFYEQVLVKNPNRAVIEALFKIEGARTAGFVRYLRFELVVTDRAASITADIQFDIGAVTVAVNVWDNATWDGGGSWE